ncbi:hypothetical protein J437_LFUL016242 [Ladona fulva]|uniref:Mutator-like transposase domain-containing protein n=1 Tax=Ladona fulva TaxID=123851 RepID=A0A8K0KPC8_LADFU|nr:hypothetical protein J437_LFUL016242 [Ladona fulva]
MRYDQKRLIIIEILVKNSSCKSCEYWEDKSMKNGRQNMTNCTANHTGSVGKMEMDAIIEMFSRSKECYSIMYVNYIVDSKMYKGVLYVKPYGDGFAINKR